jgi:hypothetical protein
MALFRCQRNRPISRTRPMRPEDVPQVLVEERINIQAA